MPAKFPIYTPTGTFDAGTYSDYKRQRADAAGRPPSYGVRVFQQPPAVKPSLPIEDKVRELDTNMGDLISAVEETLKYVDYGVVAFMALAGPSGNPDLDAGRAQIAANLRAAMINSVCKVVFDALFRAIGDASTYMSNGGFGEGMLTLNTLGNALSPAATNSIQPFMTTVPNGGFRELKSMIAEAVSSQRTQDPLQV